MVGILARICQAVACGAVLSALRGQAALRVVLRDVDGSSTMHRDRSVFGKEEPLIRFLTIHTAMEALYAPSLCEFVQSASVSDRFECVRDRLKQGRVLHRQWIVQEHLLRTSRSSFRSNLIDAGLQGTLMPSAYQLRIFNE